MSKQTHKPNTKRSAETQHAGTSKQTLYPPVTSQQEANERFAASLGAEVTSSQTGSISAFLLLMQRIFDTNRSFTYGEVLAGNQLLELDERLLAKLFTKYTEAMQSWGVLERVPKEKSCYGCDVFFRLV